MPRDLVTSTQVLRRFRVVFNAVRSHFRQMEKRVGLGGTQVWALRTIANAPGIGTGGIALEMDIHQSTTSNLVKKLPRKNSQIHLLPAGKSLKATECLPLILGLALCMPTAPSFAEQAKRPLYRCATPRQVTYSDRPCQKGDHTESRDAMAPADSRRARLPAALQSECATLEKRIPIGEAELPNATGERRARMQADLYKLQMRHKKIGC